MALTVKFIEAIKPDGSGRQTFSDKAVEGLELRVGATGIKTWTLRFRMASGERRRMTLGRYPMLSLADARIRSITMLAQAKNGSDPTEEKRQEKEEAKVEVEAKAKEKARTLSWLATLYFEAPEVQAKSANSMRHETWLWRRHIQPRMGEKHIGEIGRADVRNLVREVAVGTGQRTANYTHAMIRQFYNFAIREEIAMNNPAMFEQMFKCKSRERVLTVAELQRLWGALENASTRGSGISPATAIVLKLCLLTLQRVGEIVGMRTDELDLEARSWTIPSHRSKNRRAHFVPLSGAAVALIQSAIEIERKRLKLSDQDQYDGPVFSSFVHPGQSLERHVVTRAMARVCDLNDIVDATPHDLRRTASSFMASERCGVRGDVIGRILNHTPGGAAVTQIYNRYDYSVEKRAAMDAWSIALQRMLEPKKEKDKRPEYETQLGMLF